MQQSSNHRATIEQPSSNYRALITDGHAAARLQGAMVICGRPQIKGRACAKPGPSLGQTWANLVPTLARACRCSGLMLDDHFKGMTY